MKQMMKKWLLLAAVTLPPTSQAATNYFSFDGTLLNNGVGMGPTQNLKIQIYAAPSSSTCLLYEETFANVPVDSVTGAFSIKVGSGVNTGASPLTFAQIFKNSGNMTGALTCPYTPAVTDGRFMKVTVGSHCCLEVMRSPPFRWRKSRRRPRASMAWSRLIY